MVKVMMIMTVPLKENITTRLGTMIRRMHVWCGTERPETKKCVHTHSLSSRQFE